MRGLLNRYISQSRHEPTCAATSSSAGPSLAFGPDTVLASCSA
jgi:hypothetical protein